MIAQPVVPDDDANSLQSRNTYGGRRFPVEEDASLESLSFLSGWLAAKMSCYVTRSASPRRAALGDKCLPCDD